jgi:hypothetical protein
MCQASEWPHIGRVGIFWREAVKQTLESRLEREKRIEMGVKEIASGDNLESIVIYHERGSKD